MQSRLQLFISYRRIDSAGYAGRIYQNLANRFQVFFDTEGIPYGHVFPDVLRNNVEQADICLVIIGKESCREFQKRVEGVDYVVEEIYHAQISHTLIIPILIEGAMMPERDCLPDKIAFLADLHAYQIGHNSFTRDMAELLSHIDKQPPKPTDMHQQHFTQEVMDRLEKERLLVLFSQDFTPIDAYRSALETTLKSRFGKDFYTVAIPSYVDDQEEYFQEIAECCGLQGSVSKLHDWKKAMGKRLQSKLQPVMLLITDFEDGNEEYDKQFAKALRSLKSKYHHLYVLFIGRKALANMVYKDGGLSPLYNVEQRFFPEHGLKLGREKIVTQFHSLNGKYRSYLCELLEEEDLGDFTPWSSNVTINELFWRNLLVKHEERMIWRGQLTCQIGREVLECDHP